MTYQQNERPFNNQTIYRQQPKLISNNQFLWVIEEQASDSIICQFLLESGIPTQNKKMKDANLLSQIKTSEPRK